MFTTWKTSMILSFLMMILIFVFCYLSLVLHHEINLNVFTISVKETTEEELGVMERRNRIIRDVCELKFSETLKRTAAYYGAEKNWNSVLEKFLRKRGKQFVYNERQQFVMCLNPKAGSLSISTALLNAMNKTSKSLLTANTELIQLSKEVVRKNIQQFQNLTGVTRFLNVRHPFSRFLSGFRDRTRTVRKILINWSKLHGRKFNLAVPLSTFFAEFVEAMLEMPTRQWESHFVPIFISCLPCHFEFDCIIKTESSQDDIECLSEGLRTNLQYRKKHTTKLSSMEAVANLKNSTSDVSTEDFQAIYYSKISMEQLVKLYDRFEMDFLLFNYTIRPYVQYVKTKQYGS